MSVVRSVPPITAERPPWWSPWLIVAAVLLAYANSVTAPLVLDDYYSVIENPTIHQVWPPGPMFSPPAKSGTGGRPLANATFAFSYALSGAQPWGHHVVGVALHALTALTLFGVVRRTLRQPVLSNRVGAVATPLATLTALLWAVHPLQTQVVTYVSQRTEGLMALAYLMVLYAFIRAAAGEGRRWWAVLGVAALAGMACKEVMVTMPAAVLLYDAVFVAGSFEAAWRRRWPVYLGLVATWGLLAALLIGVSARDVGFGLGASPVDYALTSCRSLVLYLGLTLWPSPLIFDRGSALVTSVTAAAPWVAAVVALAGLVGWAWCRNRPLGFALLWFFLILAPTTSVVPVVQQPMAENRPYLALAGLIVLAVVALHRRCGRLAWAVGGAVVVVALTATIARNRVYATEVGLWRDTVAKAPDNVRARHNLGAAWQKRGRPDEAMAAYREALALDPRYFYAHASLGETLVELGRDAEAIPHLRAALALEPRLPKTTGALGVALFRTGVTAEGLEQLTRAVALDPTAAEARYNLGVALHRAGRLPEAMTSFRGVLERDPRHRRAWNNLGLAQLQSGAITDAVATFEQALTAAGDAAETRHNLATALGNSGRIPAAVSNWEAALRLDPGYAPARQSLEQARAMLAAPGSKSP